MFGGSRTLSLYPVLLASALGWAACSDDGGEAPADTALDAAGDAVADVLPDGVFDGGQEVSGDPADEPLADAPPADVQDDEDAGPRVWDFAVGPPFAPPGEDVLAGTGVDSCAVYGATRCDAGTAYSCQVYDAEAAAFVAEGDLDPLYAKVLWFERWYDLYHQPQGQTVQRMLSPWAAAGTPEAEWADPARFEAYEGAGDAAIWTGVALESFLLRYLETGTEADYQRFETKVRQLVRLFDVTGITGYLARYHFLQLPEGGPDTTEIIVRYGEGPVDWRERAIPNPESVPGVPPEYLDGIEDSDGTTWNGTPMWRGNPSIDQYTGPMVAFPAAWSLVRDEALRDRMAEHLVCYLTRLRRIELINLQQNEDALAAVQALLAGGQLDLDEDDIDFATLDTVVAFVHAQLNTVNEETFDTSCPDGPPLEPSVVIDATSQTFTLELVNLALDLQSRVNERANGIDHIYAPSVRGGDAVHMMHLAAMAWYFTGDDRYAAFLQDDLLGTIRADEVAQTMGALVPPHWCHAFYGPHITIPPLWAFINLLRDSPLRDEMLSVFQREAWEKVALELGNAKFDLEYLGVVPESAGSAHEMALARALMALEEMGGNGGVAVDPRRNYSLPYETVLAGLGSGVEPVCPTPAERAECEVGYNVLGITIPGSDISYDCRGEPGECVFESDGQCARPMASSALQVDLRVHSDFIWQRNPFEMGRLYSDDGHEQTPGLDVTEIFWLARRYGVTDAGEGQALAWREVGVCGE